MALSRQALATKASSKPTTTTKSTSRTIPAASSTSGSSPATQWSAPRIRTLAPREPIRQLAQAEPRVTVRAARLSKATGRCWRSELGNREAHHARQNTGQHVIGHDADAFGFGVLHGVDHAGLPDV